MSKQKAQQKQNIPTKISSFTMQKHNLNNHSRQQLKQLINESIMSQSQYSNSTFSQQDVVDQGKQKLIELTRQCSQYFQKFTAENDNHIKIIMNIFDEFSHQIQANFNKIIKSIIDKLQQIKDYLKRQENRLIGQRKQQQQSLNFLLMEIHTVHLTKIEESSKATNEHLTEYAFTLNKFFNKMQQIQCKINEESIQDSINFINNLSKEELTSIIDSHLSKKINNHHPISVQPQNYFTFENESLKPLQESQLFDRSNNLSNRFIDSSTKVNQDLNKQLYEQLEKIKQNHIVRQKRLKYYNEYLEKNHFSYVKLRQ